MPIVIIIAAILLGGAAIGARTSLPGDTFYPVKLEINEKLRTLIAIGDESNARSRIRAIEHRLEETERLMDQGKLTAPVRTILEQHVAREVVSIQMYIDALAERGNIEDAARVEAELKAVLKQKKIALKTLSRVFNDENLDSFMYGRVFSGNVPTGASDVQTSSSTSSTTTTQVKISKPIIEGPTSTPLDRP
jgi:hypothetical protein